LSAGSTGQARRGGKEGEQHVEEGRKVRVTVQQAMLSCIVHAMSPEPACGCLLCVLKTVRLSVYSSSLCWRRHSKCCFQPPQLLPPHLARYARKRHIAQPKQTLQSTAGKWCSVAQTPTGLGTASLVQTAAAAPCGGVSGEMRWKYRSIPAWWPPFAAPASACARDPMAGPVATAGRVPVRREAATTVGRATRGTVAPRLSSSTPKRSGWRHSSASTLPKQLCGTVPSTAWQLLTPSAT
jgi:hypothetical protein